MELTWSNLERAVDNFLSYYMIRKVYGEDAEGLRSAAKAMYNLVHYCNNTCNDFIIQKKNSDGHFVLTATLFPFLSRDGAKVINVSSEAINFAQGGLDTDNLNGEQSYSPWPAYGQSKLSNVLFTKELQRKADNAGQDWLTSVTLHTGVVSTDLWRNIVGEERFNDIKGSIPSGVESIVSNMSLL